MTDALTDKRSGSTEYLEKVRMAQTGALGSGSVGPFDRPQVRVASDGTVTKAPVHGAGSILSEASQIVEGVRNQQHGEKERSFIAIANVWDAYLENRRVPGDKLSAPLRPHDVANMMVLMKMMRAEWGTPIRDHFVDMAGYSGIAGELAMSALKGGVPEG